MKKVAELTAGSNSLNESYPVLTPLWVVSLGRENVLSRRRRGVVSLGKENVLSRRRGGRFSR